MSNHRRQDRALRVTDFPDALKKGTVEVRYKDASRDMKSYVDDNTFSLVFGLNLVDAIIDPYVAKDCVKPMKDQGNKQSFLYSWGITQYLAPV